MEEQGKLTQVEKRKNRIAQLKALLQQEEAKQHQEERKKRTGQLVAFGVYLEAFFKASDDEARKQLEESIKKHLSGRNLERALEGIKRLSE